MKGQARNIVGGHLRMSWNLLSGSACIRSGMASVGVEGWSLLQAGCFPVRLHLYTHSHSLHSLFPLPPLSRTHVPSVPPIPWLSSPFLWWALCQLCRCHLSFSLTQPVFPSVTSSLSHSLSNTSYIACLLPGPLHLCACLCLYPWPSTPLLLVSELAWGPTPCTVLKSGKHNQENYITDRGLCHPNAE